MKRTIRVLINKKTGSAMLDWYYPEFKQLVCKLCSKEESSENCKYCVNTNPYCG